MSTAISGSGARTAKILSGAAMLFAIVFWLVAVTPYLSSSRESFGEFADIFWDRRYGLWLHILGGTIALFLGPVQIWLGETRQRYPLHRTLGTVYGVGVAISSAGAFYMVFTTPVGPVYAAGLFGMAVAALGATVMAFRAIRHRAIAQHREWMLRGYVAILAFVFFRALLAALEALGVGGEGRPGASIRVAFAAWASWALPLLVTEWCLQWGKVRAR